jgi:hypothetical protein
MTQEESGHPEPFDCHSEPSHVILSNAKDLVLLRVNSVKSLRAGLREGSLGCAFV